ncbi:LuxR C-terminal-related transcriptional regulator [Paraburkholderia sp. FT54]|nr:LuxR C-terminal-related transcriptional regulator [Paraburkholderia sp. FT54]WNC94346.1 LuxR C-terminal-related transcriptional regulator [Paraburkholderia sp. FT54]
MRVAGDTAGGSAGVVSLSPREKEVMAFVLSGLLNKQIASGMNPSGLP